MCKGGIDRDHGVGKQLDEVRKTAKDLYSIG